MIQEENEKLSIHTKIWIKNCLKIQRERNKLKQHLIKLSLALENEPYHVRAKYQAIIKDALDKK